MVTWVEEQFKLFFKESHETLKQKPDQSSEVKKAINDVLSMVNLDDKKWKQKEYVGETKSYR